MAVRNTRNYGWLVPDQNELLGLGAEEIRDLGNDIDASMSTVQGMIPSLAGYVTQSGVTTQLGSYTTNLSLLSLIQFGTNAGQRMVAGVTSVAQNPLTASISVPYLSTVRLCMLMAQGEWTDTISQGHTGWPFIYDQQIAGNVVTFHVGINNSPTMQMQGLVHWIAVGS